MLQRTSVKQFFDDPDNHSSIWFEHLKSYVPIPNKRRDTQKFMTLDAWYCALDLSKGYVTRYELVEIMKWKLTRGEMRPLLKKIEALSNDAVQSATLEGLQHIKLSLDDKSVASALNAISKPLSGVGPATASAILARYSSSLPFMSDAGLITTGCELKYTTSNYIKYYNIIRMKVAQLNDDHQSKHTWTARDVESVLHFLHSKSGTKISIQSDIEVIQETHDNVCSAVKKDGTRCSYKAKINDKCGVHSK